MLHIVLARYVHSADCFLRIVAIGFLLIRVALNLQQTLFVYCVAIINALCKLNCMIATKVKLFYLH